jgi:hypothetical protein
MGKVFIAFVIAVLLWSCSTTKVETTKKTEKVLTKQLVHDVNLFVEKNVSWVNLMPGAKPKFHISGKISLLKGKNYNIKSTTLKFIKVFQNGKEIYFIKPKIREEIKDNEKNYLFSTISGLSIVKELDTKKKVDFEFIFMDGKKDLIYQIKNVELQEVH